jgi:hypothetical protein
MGSPNFFDIFLFDSFYYKKNFWLHRLQELFLSVFFTIFDQTFDYFGAWAVKKLLEYIFTSSFYYTKQQTISKKFARVTARTIFVRLFFTIFD